MSLEISGLEDFKRLADELVRELDTGLDHFTHEVQEESVSFSQQRLDGDFPQPGGIRFLNEYYHPELDMMVDHMTVDHTKTGRLSRGIKAKTKQDGFEVIASALDPYSGKNYAAKIAEEDDEMVNMDYLSFGPYQFIKEMESGGMDSIIKQSFPKLN